MIDVKMYHKVVYGVHRYPIIGETTVSELPP
jgi:hypothetical protein